jgi:tetratricopeptide (TPR) repeat protein
MVVLLLQIRNTAIDQDGLYVIVVVLFLLPSYSGGNMTSVAPRPSSAVSALDKNGEYLAILGKQSQAIEYFEKALAIDPNDKRTLSDIGVVYSIQGNYIQAIQYFDKALSIDPNYNTAVLGKVVSLSKMGHHHK